MTRTTKYDWKLGKALAGPCMACHTETAECHRQIEFDVGEGETAKISLLLCGQCARLPEHAVLTKLGFFDKIRGAK